MNRSVAIVGRPNVGKSRLFNRLARSRIAIVHDQAGVTRDVISTEIEEGDFILMDTGGLGLTGDDSTAGIIAASEQQVAFAIDTAGLILMIVDGKDGINALDFKVAEMLRRSTKPVQLVINKVDFSEEKLDLAEVYRLGLGEPIYFSAEHGRGEADLRIAILAHLGPVPEEVEEEGNKPLCICFVGKPNVGKSSLSNRLMRSDRLIVSDQAGTTRDSIEVPFDFEGRDGKMHPFVLIDTAGIRAQTKLSSPVEYFSRLRSIEAIQKADVVFIVVDAVEGVHQQDKAIAGEALKEKKPIVVVVNKWDLVHKQFTEDGGIHGYEDERDYREKYKRSLFHQLFFTPGAPLVFVSAVSGYEVDRMLNAAVKLYRTADRKIPTARLNKTLQFLTERTPPPSVGGQRFRVYYATQTGNRPFRIRMFCNREEKLTESYRRYLEAGVVKEFKLEGCPVYFELIGKPKGGALSHRPHQEGFRHKKWQIEEDGERPRGPDSSFETLED